MAVVVKEAMKAEEPVEAETAVTREEERAPVVKAVAVTGRRFPPGHGRSESCRRHTGR